MSSSAAFASGTYTNMMMKNSGSLNSLRVRFILLSKFKALSRHQSRQKPSEFRDRIRFYGAKLYELKSSLTR